MDFEWWFNLLKVLGKTFFMILMCGVMKIKYLIFPEAKKRDFELMAKEKKVEITEENKNIGLVQIPVIWIIFFLPENKLWQDLMQCSKTSTRQPNFMAQLPILSCSTLMAIILNY